MSLHPILIAGQWRPAQATGSFRAENPATGEALPDEFPISSWADCESALAAAAEAATQLGQVDPKQSAHFLSAYADRIEAHKVELAEAAHLETALPKAPRLAEVELPRTVNQLRQAAAALLDGAWAQPTIDTRLNIRSLLGPIGPVLVIGPNNFPFAYNGVAGGDFASAIAAGNPVIAKAHPCHPSTTRLLAELAFAAVQESGLPGGTVQLLYHVAPEDGLRLVRDRRLGAVGFTGSRAAGMQLKAAADAVGKPIYAEMSSINPVIILPGALRERGAKIGEELSASCLLGSGQFCTSPGLTLLFAGPETESFIGQFKARLAAAAAGTLLSSGVARNLAASVRALQAAGAELLTGGQPLPGNRFANTCLRISAAAFLAAPAALQTEAFGNASLLVVAGDAGEAASVLAVLEGNLTGSIYSDTGGTDDPLYARLAPLLRARVGRLINDKMPTGVAVTAAMNHGGPFPATGHPGFTAVGFPAAIRRFAMLQCYDNVRLNRLPAALQNANPHPGLWRLVDGVWSQANIPG